MNLITKLAMALHSVKCNSVMTDKAVLSYEHDGELKVGDEVYVERESEGEVEMVPAEDGEYVADMIVIVVKDGKVEEIRDEKPEEEAPAEETPAEATAMEGEDAPADAPAEDVDKPAEEEKSAEERIAILEEAVQALREALEAKASAEAELVERVSALEAKIADLEKPADAPAEKVDEPMQASAVKPSSARMRAWAEMNKR